MNGYWIICINGYEYDGVEIPKGRMNFHTSIRPVINDSWRRATEIEVEQKQYFKGNAYLPPNLRTF